MDVRRSIAQTNRFTAAVRKLLSIKGEEHEISYGVHLEEERPEYSFLKQEVRWIQYNEVTSAAGTLPIIGVANPGGSGILTVITSVFANLEAAGVELRLVLNRGAPPVASAPMHPLDLRFLKGLAAFATTSLGLAGAAAAGGGTYEATRFTSLAANDTIDFLAHTGGRVSPIILDPGSQAWLSCGAVGVHTLKATFVGYERSLESGELI